MGAHREDGREVKMVHVGVALETPVHRQARVPEGQPAETRTITNEPEREVAEAGSDGVLRFLMVSQHVLICMARTVNLMARQTLPVFALVFARTNVADASCGSFVKN